VSASEVGLLARVAKALGRKLPDRLEHPESLPLAHADEALVDERLQPVDVRAADRFGRLEGAAAAEDGKAGEQPLLVFREEVVAPIDRRAQRLLARLGVASCLEQIEPLRKTLEDLGREFGVSKERVRQLEQRALGRLKTEL